MGPSGWHQTVPSLAEEVEPAGRARRFQLLRPGSEATARLPTSRPGQRPSTNAEAYGPARRAECSSNIMHKQTKKRCRRASSNLNNKGPWYGGSTLPGLCLHRCVNNLPLPNGATTSRPSEPLNQPKHTATPAPHPISCTVGGSSKTTSPSELTSVGMQWRRKITVRTEEIHFICLACTGTREHSMTCKAATEMTGSVKCKNKRIIHNQLH